jgi:hypothetical protein
VQGSGQVDSRVSLHSVEGSVSKSTVIYKLTYPNGKIYVGKDLPGTLTYFGTADRRSLALKSASTRDLTVRKQILWESDSDSATEVNRKEVEFIRELRSNDPAIGYNRWPSFP